MLPRQPLRFLLADDPGAGNDYLRERFWPSYNKRFSVSAREDGDAFVPLGGVDLDDILCL